MRLALKFAVVLVPLGVADSAVFAAAHCIAVRNVGGSGSAISLTLGYATHDDCGFHENAANANRGSDNKIRVISVGRATFFSSDLNRTCPLRASIRRSGA